MKGYALHTVPKSLASERTHQVADQIRKHQDWVRSKSEQTVVTNIADAVDYLSAFNALEKTPNEM